ncbi:hypothetical protein Rleg4DRAFT_6525 [Rhizobium leguminosarum bv. trifolii WSM2297]|uniref:Uncharacterized protein n=1 Tax=Rhizobium leguminosarum bv. trifolii WSM2297 TaxID=754762 RepID=J0L0P5_RHILT|nr:hypothetical protein Rleg4DRAFT_5496 [Rhizobium leguminosarum bv. trifolii WSM2297]EJC84690.1 hypothetical protein Rleg4DRAFT_6525 [Rhizobium leguminosarum bv. trifolii WSM2297]
MRSPPDTIGRHSRAFFLVFLRTSKTALARHLDDAGRHKREHVVAS